VGTLPLWMEGSRVRHGREDIYEGSIVFWGVWNGVVLLGRGVDYGVR
jgi:hypothetical protein